MNGPWRRATRAVTRRRQLWAAWRRVSREERRQLIRLAFLIPACRAGLRLLGYRRTRSLMDGLARRGAASTPTDASIDNLLERALERARRFAPYRGNCLSQSLALWYELRRHGRPAELCLGARMNDGQFSAHAWVECDGTALTEGPASRSKWVPFQSSALS